MSRPVVHQSDEAIRDESARSARALYALLDLSKALSSEVDLDHLLTIVVEKASLVIDAERTRILLYDPERQVLWTRTGSLPERIEIPIGSGVAGYVAATLELANIADASRDPRYDAESGRSAGSILSSPVLDSKGKLLGIIESVNKTTASRFDAQDESLMRTLAAHVGVAIERARLTEMYLESERFGQSLSLASEIQMRMLPPGTVITPENAPFAIHAYVQPARMVGGDFYDFFWNDQRLYFCIGDVAGKGIGAALVMAVSKTLLRAHATLQTDPAKVIAAVNARLYEETDTNMFVTALCGFLDLNDGRLLYTNAGHDRPLVLSAGSAIRTLDAKPGLALGIVPGFAYSAVEGSLSLGEALFLYTDGVTEATNRSEALFTIGRVHQAIEDARVQDPPRVVRAVLEGLKSFAGEAAQADDITMMCIQYRGNRP